MGRALFLSFVALMFIIQDIYCYFGLKSFALSDRNFKIIRFSYLTVTIFSYLALIGLIIYFVSGAPINRTQGINFLVGLLFALFFSKIIFSLSLLIQDSGRVFIGAFNYINSFFKQSSDEHVFMPHRRQFISTAGTFLSGSLFFSMLYGITKGKYKYTVENIQIPFEELPEAFNGFKIVQISDIHAGSFDNHEKVALGIEKINALNPDIVCFTGDLINFDKEEINPYIDVFAKIKSKYGKFAIMGNHDYFGSYNHSDPEAEKAYFDDFEDKVNQMGFELLNNTNRTVTLGDQSIHIIGVENWGKDKWFPKKGDLKKAVAGMEDNTFNVLLSHDPTHWDEKVKHFDKKMHLTLSGHTHGFQFGVKMKNFQWSPAEYRYDKWAGLYTENDRHLYVNRGFGFLGFPGRVGMWPEITLIELQTKHHQ